ncbi:hypothetical protein DENSPDRAFT_814046 [Dentipellis sp. KUC8613]|nr:hypothetical protein DENSPDRAFT_814046 [Dentipellis sp. KUC8613]
MLLIPRPPEFSTAEDTPSKAQDEESDQEMTLLNEGADAIPAKETRDTPKKHYRLIIIGKKQLPDPEASGGRRGRVFWADIAAVGDDLESVEKGLDEKSYETKTRGTRHEAPARLAGRGAYAIVNNDPRVPSGRETHLGYHLSHPSDMGEVQEALGIHTASSFVLQVKNPLAPPSGGQRGLSEDRRAKYPDWVMKDIFGKGGEKGRESYGLRFASVERPELLDYEGTELLLIASHMGDEGLETSLGEGRGHALHEAEEEESKETINEVFRELATDREKFPAEPLEGRWI